LAGANVRGGGSRFGAAAAPVSADGSVRTLGGIESRV